MKKKTFEKIRIIIVITLGIMIGVSVSLKISFIPPLAIVIAAFLIHYLFRHVDEIVADERDYKLAGKAARATLIIVSISLAAIGAGLIAYGANNSYVYKLGRIFLYIVSFTLVTNIFTYLIYQKRGDK
jgi:uncharacterized membrane protein